MPLPPGSPQTTSLRLSNGKWTSSHRVLGQPGPFRLTGDSAAETDGTFFIFWFLHYETDFKTSGFCLWKQAGQTIEHDYAIVGDPFTTNSVYAIDDPRIANTHYWYMQDLGSDGGDRQFCALYFCNNADIPLDELGGLVSVDGSGSLVVFPDRGLKAPSDVPANARFKTDFPELGHHPALSNLTLGLRRVLEASRDCDLENSALRLALKAGGVVNRRRSTSRSLGMSGIPGIGGTEKYTGAALLSGQSLNTGEFAGPPSGPYLYMNGPSLTLFVSDGIGSPARSVWASGLEQTSCNITIMQTDGNLVSYEPVLQEKKLLVTQGEHEPKTVKQLSLRPRGTSDTAGHPGAYLAFTAGYLQILYQGYPIWDSRTDKYRHIDY